MNPSLLERLRSVPSPAIIAIPGFGGAGKSTLAAEIGRHLDAPVIGVDSFIRDRHLTEYTHWDLVDYERLDREVLVPFSTGRTPTKVGHFDWHTNQVTTYRALPDSSRIVVEGVGLFRPSLTRYFSLTIWIECPLDEAIRRGKKRDREVYDNPQDENWDGVWRRNDEEYERLYQPARIADAIHDNRMVSV